MTYRLSARYRAARLCALLLTAFTIVGAPALLVAALLGLTGCGGGGDDPDQADPAMCIVDGKPMPREVCR